MSRAEPFDHWQGGQQVAQDEEVESEEGPRWAWEVASWIIVALSLILNLVVVVTIAVKRNAITVVNKAILTLGIADLLYGILVAPFYVENYIHTDWEQSLDYCRFFEYVFTFHDLFVPLVLILLSTYVSLKFSGAVGIFRFKKQMYVGLFVLVLIFSLLLAVPATVHTSIFQEHIRGKPFKEECRSLDTYSMVLSYFLSSSLLFCFTMSFLFSLCIVGSPLLRDVYDSPEDYSQRWKLLLTLSLVNIFYIITGFLINFKEVSRMVYDCCEINEPFLSTNTLTYDIWSFILLISEPFLRPLATLAFYFKYLLRDPMAFPY